MTKRNEHLIFQRQERRAARVRATHISQRIEMDVPMDIKYLIEEEQRNTEWLQEERKKVLHCEAMLQHAQQYVDSHLRNHEEQIWLRHLTVEQVMYESLERDKQHSATSLWQAQY